VELEDLKQDLLTKDEKLKDYEEASSDLRLQLDSNRQDLSNKKDLESEIQALKHKLQDSLKLQEELKESKKKYQDVQKDLD
jgi:hypothetical protein